jgi:hypothetical protein
MTLDKELYRKAYQLYREWNEEELRWRVRHTGQLSPQEGWKRYADLWEFCMKLAPTPSEQQRKIRSAEREAYYDRMQRIESWRRTHGKIP